MPNVMVALPNIGGALYSTPQSLADAHYYMPLFWLVPQSMSRYPRLSFSWFVCVLALSPVRTLAVPLVRVTGWPPRHHLSSRRLTLKVYRTSSTCLSENVRVSTDMRKSQNLFERRS